MLVQLWPYINDMVIKILKENVEPEIQKNMPSFLSSIHFEEISLGQVVSDTMFHCFISACRVTISYYPKLPFIHGTYVVSAFTT